MPPKANPVPFASPNLPMCPHPNLSCFYQQPVLCLHSPQDGRLREWQPGLGHPAPGCAPRAEPGTEESPGICRMKEDFLPPVLSLSFCSTRPHPLAYKYALESPIIKKWSFLDSRGLGFSPLFLCSASKQSFSKLSTHDKVSAWRPTMMVATRPER